MNSEQKSVFYVGTFSGYLYVVEFDRDQEELFVINRVQHSNRPAYLCLSDNRKFLYTANENSDGLGGVSAYDISDQYAPKHINTISFTTEGPCHVSLTDDQRYLLSAGYFDGRVIVNPVNPDGSLAESSCIIQHQGSGPFRGGTIVSSQAQARAHFIRQVPGTRYILVTDLGTDKVYVYTLSDGKLIEHSTVTVAPGAGPRHFDILPSGRTVYLICELGNIMYVLDFDKENGILKEVQHVSTLPEGYEGKSSAAAVHIAEDGRFLYGSNRNYDSIAVFSIDEHNHRITPLEYFKTTVKGRLKYYFRYFFEGRGSAVVPRKSFSGSYISTIPKYPRDFRMDPTGQYMLIGNMNSNSISLCRISQITGKLEYVSRVDNLELPACILFY